VPEQADRIYAAERKFGYGGWFCDVADAQVYVADLLVVMSWHNISPSITFV